MPPVTATAPSSRSLIPRLFLLALSAVALLCSVAGLRPHSAHADFSWCWDDPIVSFNGFRVHTNIGILGDQQQIKRDISNTTLVYQVPAGVNTRLVMNNGFLSPHVRFETSDTPWNPGDPIPVVIIASFRSRTVYQAQLVSTHGATTLDVASGTTDTSIRSSFLLSVPDSDHDDHD